MSSPRSPDQDAELKALLEQTAATAGDPPAHGLERVATLRRRRMRHRRGAVATTMALAVSGVATITWLNLGQQDHDLSVASESDASRGPAEPPDVLEVHCDPTGIIIPVATIQPQADGLHVEVVNESNRTMRVSIVAEVGAESNGWDSGPVAIEPGTDHFVQPVRPGGLTIGCQPAGGTTASDRGDTGDEGERRQVFLVDPDGLYTEPALACAATAQSLLDEDLPERSETSSFNLAVRSALASYWDDDKDVVAALTAYPEQGFGHPTEHPVVQVLRDGEPVAFVELDGDGTGPWTGVAEVTACEEFLADPEADDSESDDEADDDDNNEDESEGGTED